MNLLQENGVSVPRYQVANSPEEAYTIAHEFGKSKHLAGVLLKSLNIIMGQCLFSFINAYLYIYIRDICVYIHLSAFPRS